MNTIISNTEREEVSTSGVTKANSCFRILVVEDDPAILNLNVRVLLRAGYLVDSAADGQEGWEALCARRYDLLVTDLNMPRMTGLELIERLRFSQEELPIILATGAALSEDMVQGDGLKSVSLLQKPFRNAQLLERIKQFLE